MAEAPRVDTAQLMELLSVALGSYYGDFTAAAASENLTASQGKTLTVLRRGPVAMRALAETMACDASNVTGIINRLEKRGLVRREASTSDRRVTNLVITPEGERVIIRSGRKCAPPETVWTASATTTGIVCTYCWNEFSSPGPAPERTHLRRSRKQGVAGHEFGEVRVFVGGHGLPDADGDAAYPRTFVPTSRTTICLIEPGYLVFDRALHPGVAAAAFVRRCPMIHGEPTGRVGSRFSICSEEFANDPHGAYAAMRERYGDLVPIELAPGVPATLVIGYSAALRILNDPERFRADPRNWQNSIPADSLVRPMMEWNPTVLRSSGELHQRYRRAHVYALDGIDLHQLRHDVEHIAVPLINSFCGSGRPISSLSMRSRWFRSAQPFGRMHPGVGAAGGGRGGSAFRRSRRGMGNGGPWRHCRSSFRRRRR
ncbi:MarR family transcriptional regulator [Nocardia asiatica]|uniref:MarR family winged helix-turn-helix transcriptional regulator n=1 Tax=Nocardia asiatica TaxID=209252 RepID=UPI003EE294B9